MKTDLADHAGTPESSVAGTVAVVAALCLLGWLTYTRDGWVPFLSGVDFGIHELGHLLFMWAPRPLMVLAGSALQVAAPVLLAAYFWFGRRQRLSAALLLGWAGSSLNNVSVYIFDATRLALPLWGDLDGTGANHDWRYLLGPQVLDALQATDAIAYTVRAASVVLFVAAVGMAASTLVTAYRDRSRVKRLEVRRQTLEVREPRSWTSVPVEASDEGGAGTDARTAPTAGGREP